MSVVAELTFWAVAGTVVLGLVVVVLFCGLMKLVQLVMGAGHAVERVIRRVVLARYE